MNVQPAQSNKAHNRNPKAPIRLAGVIAIPGNPLVTSDIVWVDPGTKKFYFADRSNFSVDVIDAENNLFVGRIPGFAGPQTARGDPYANATTPPPNGEGPSGVLVTREKKLWASDGDSTVRVADVDPASSNYLRIIKSVSTSIPECGSHCDRADELGYDATDHIILVANNQPFAAIATTPPTRSDPYATFISADSYRVLGHVVFEGATGLEQPLWDPELHRFFVTVPGYRNNGGSNNGFAEIAVIDPKAMKVERTLKPGNCHAGRLSPRSHRSAAVTKTGITPEMGDFTLRQPTRARPLWIRWVWLTRRPAHGCKMWPIREVDKRPLCRAATTFSLSFELQRL
jgi:hypothetical protein